MRVCSVSSVPLRRCWCQRARVPSQLMLRLFYMSDTLPTKAVSPSSWSAKSVLFLCMFADKSMQRRLHRWCHSMITSFSMNPLNRRSSQTSWSSSAQQQTWYFSSLCSGGSLIREKRQPTSLILTKGLIWVCEKCCDVKTKAFSFLSSICNRATLRSFSWVTQMERRVGPCAIRSPRHVSTEGKAGRAAW